MNSPEASAGGWKAKVSHELIEYAFNVVYLALVFASFTMYRRLSLAAYDIQYTNYWVAVVEALILGKVIMIGAILRLGRGLEDKPLIYSTLYKTVVFTVFVVVFKAIEHGLKGLWEGQGFTGGLAAISEKSLEIMLADALVVLVAFIPFFAVKELTRVLGTKRIWDLFFRRRTAS
jgi:hypothetical protein